MKINRYKELAVLTFTFAFLAVGSAEGQIQSAGGGYYVAGYGTVYGSFGQASAAQSRMYDSVKAQSSKAAARNALVQKWGLAAVEKAERQAAAGNRSAPSDPQIVVAPPPVVRNYGLFRPDPSVNSGKVLADALGSTPEEKALISRIYAATKTEFEKEAAQRGWKNNIAAGLTFFTVASMTAYHNSESPSDEAVNAYYKVINAVLDDTPELAGASNKDKQGFNNALVGFGGMILAVYLDAKQTNDAAALGNSRKLAGMLIEMVLKTNPENLRLENGQIVLK